MSERECDQPTPSDSFKRCTGSYVKSQLCDDSDVCTGKTRPLAVDYASEQCAKFSGLVPFIDPRGEGLQAPYSPGIKSKTCARLIQSAIAIVRLSAGRAWQSCAIFCKRQDRDAYYSPRFELNNLPQVSAFFPDGTWCGNDAGKELYCLQRTCVPMVGGSRSSLSIA